MYGNPYMHEEYASPWSPKGGVDAMMFAYTDSYDDFKDDIKDDDSSSESIEECPPEHHFGEPAAALATQRAATPATRSASPGAALLARSSPDRGHRGRKVLEMEEGLPPPRSPAGGMPLDVPTPAKASSPSRYPRNAAGHRYPSAPPSRLSNGDGGPSTKRARSQTPSVTTPRCHGDMGEVHGDIIDSLQSSRDCDKPRNVFDKVDNPWFAAQMNFQGQRASNIEDGTSADMAAASIATLKKCMAQAEHLPSQQKPNSEKWTGRLSRVQLQGQDAI